MSISVNSFLFGSLLTSAKMTALQDSWIHVMSSFRLEHFMTDSTVAGSHTNAVVNNGHAQTITGSKTFSAPMQLSKTLNVNSSITIGGGSNTFSRVNFISGGAGTNNTWIGLDGLNNPKDALTLRTNDVGSETSADPVDPSWSFSINDGNATKIKYKASSGNPYNTIFSVSTTGVVSAGHIPSAGRAFGGLQQVGTITVGANTQWQNVSGVTSGALHCENFKLNAGITLTVSGPNFTNVMKIFATGSIDILGTIDGTGFAGVVGGGGQQAGFNGRTGGSGGGGGGSDINIGQPGGASIIGSGGSGGATTTAGGNGIDADDIICARDPKSFASIVNGNTSLMGGGGGGGGAIDTANDDGGAYSGGGAIVYMEAPLINIDAAATIDVSGGAGAANAGGGADGASGGGGGGIIYLKMKQNTIGGGATLTVAGGVGGVSTGVGGNGGVGGSGRIFYDFEQ